LSRKFFLTLLTFAFAAVLGVSSSISPEAAVVDQAKHQDNAIVTTPSVYASFLRRASRILQDITDSLDDSSEECGEDSLSDSLSDSIDGGISSESIDGEESSDDCVGGNPVVQALFGLVSLPFSFLGAVFAFLASIVGFGGQQ